MPLPSFGFGHRPSWEYEAPEGSGTALEEPRPQPISKGWRGKVAIVTGGATGLGRHISMEFGRLGCHVGFCFVNLPGRDVSEQALLTETALTAMGIEVYARRCDVRDRGSVEQFVAEVKQRLGGVHILINNAGIASDGALWRLSQQAWSEVLDTNVTGAFNCIRAVAPVFRSQHYGKIVSVSAHQAERPGFGVANYAASKAALLGLTRAAALPASSGPSGWGCSPPKSSSGRKRARCWAGWPNRMTWPMSSPSSARNPLATSPGRPSWWMEGCRWSDYLSAP
jgi:NADP-dependent 3-hydroxy acid dehydrogenase YdfG